MCGSLALINSYLIKKTEYINYLSRFVPYNRPPNHGNRKIIVLTSQELSLHCSNLWWLKNIIGEELMLSRWDQGNTPCYWFKVSPINTTTEYTFLQRKSQEHKTGFISHYIRNLFLLIHRKLFSVELALAKVQWCWMTPPSLPLMVIV